MPSLFERVRTLAASFPETAPHSGDLATAAEAAYLGGSQVRRYYLNEFSVEEGASGPVTSADRASHEAIMEFLRWTRPSEAILSEESNRDRLTASDDARLWIVDPLDGTREFIDRIDEFSVMVGLAVHGSALLGAVYRPDPGTLYLGVSDQCAWRLQDVDDAPVMLNVRAGGDSPGSSQPGVRFIRSRSHPDERLQRLETALAPSSVVLSGSVGVKCALIADGDADLYVHPVPYLKEWDTCAPEAILRGAGGRVTDCHGSSLTYGKAVPVQPAGIFAAPPDTWSRVAPVVFQLTND
jgi:3'(2'), 5'-bisphosphate nucleotidase